MSYLTLEFTLTNNDILRRLRYTFNLTDTNMIEIFAAADQCRHTTASDRLADGKESEAGHVEPSDTEFATFLNGFINTKRGKRDGEQPVPESKLNNNIILMKLRIALNMKTEDVIEVLALTDFNLSKHELSAFSRKAENKHYRVCNDQILRNFLTGIQLQNRPTISGE